MAYNIFDIDDADAEEWDASSPVSRERPPASVRLERSARAWTPDKVDDDDDDGRLPARPGASDVYARLEAALSSDDLGVTWNTEEKEEGGGGGGGGGEKEVGQKGESDDDGKMQKNGIRIQS